MLTATRLWNGWHSYAMESNDPEVIAFAQSQSKNNKDGITNAVFPPFGISFLGVIKIELRHLNAKLMDLETLNISNYLL